MEEDERSEMLPGKEQVKTEESETEGEGSVGDVGEGDYEENEQEGIKTEEIEKQDVLSCKERERMSTDSPSPPRCSPSHRKKLKLEVTPPPLSPPQHSCVHAYTGAGVCMGNAVFSYETMSPGATSVWEHLREHGWAVVGNVLTPKKVDTYVGRMWSWFEQLGTGIDRNDPATWRGDAWPRNIHGILQHYRCGHAQFVWDIRTEPKVVGSFSKLWSVEPDQLLTSFDGFCFMKGPAVSKGWPHWDQGSSKQGLQAVQGLVTLTSVESDADGGLVVWDKSHTLHADYWREYGIKSGGDWYKVPEDHMKSMEREYDIKRVVVKAPAGSLILWDSRTIHHNQPPAKGNPKQRACVYVCMTPRAKATPKNIEKRQSAFTNLRMTTHWPHTVRLFPENPRHYGKLEALSKFKLRVSPPVLSKLGLRLAGFP